MLCLALSCYRCSSVGGGGAGSAAVSLTHADEFNESVILEVDMYCVRAFCHYFNSEWGEFCFIMFQYVIILIVSVCHFLWTYMDYGVYY